MTFTDDPIGSNLRRVWNRWCGDLIECNIMANGFTYSELKTTVQNYLDNTETTFVTTLDTFIETTEERILKAVQLPVFRKNSTGTATGKVNTISNTF